MIYSSLLCVDGQAPGGPSSKRGEKQNPSNGMRKAPMIFKMWARQEGIGIYLTKE